MSDPFQTDALAASFASVQIGNFDNDEVQNNVRRYTAIHGLASKTNSISTRILEEMTKLPLAVAACDGEGILKIKTDLYHSMDELSDIKKELGDRSMAVDEASSYLHAKVTEQLHETIAMVRPFVEESDPPQGLDPLTTVVSTSK